MTGRATGGAAISAEARRLYQVLVRTVADDGPDPTTGAFPDVSDTRAGGTIADFGELVDAGLVEHDPETGLVTAVLPFVASAPSALVYMDADERLPRYAAGILDAFALAPLVGRRFRIYDSCPTCGEPVQVLTDPERIRRREPRSAVVVRVPTDHSRQGRYDTARLACSPEHAQTAIDATGNLDAVMQSIEGLVIEARQRYAAVLKQ